MEGFWWNFRSFRKDNKIFIIVELITAHLWFYSVSFESKTTKTVGRLGPRGRLHPKRNNSKPGFSSQCDANTCFWLLICLGNDSLCRIREQVPHTNNYKFVVPAEPGTETSAEPVREILCQATHQWLLEARRSRHPFSIRSRWPSLDILLER